MFDSHWAPSPLPPCWEHKHVRKNVLTAAVTGKLRSRNLGKQQQKTTQNTGYWSSWPNHKSIFRLQWVPSEPEVTGSVRTAVYTYIGSACRAGGSGARRWGWGRGRAARPAQWSAGSETERKSSLWTGVKRFWLLGNGTGWLGVLEQDTEAPHIWMAQCVCFTFTFNEFSSYPKQLIISTFVRRKRHNNIPLLVQ